MALDLAEAQKQLDWWLEASRTTSMNKSNTHASGGSNRQVIRHDPSEVREQIVFWQKMVNQFSNTSRIRHAVPL